jgi:uncharacterized protein (DUF2252 family)
MSISPFTFYRGSALSMAVDLATTPVSGIRVQCSGDAHLGNFRGFATPERRELFAINDLDETLPAPWEWDLKRLATSIVVACRDCGFGEQDARDVVLGCAEAYRKHMAELSGLTALDLWYRAIDADEAISTIANARVRKRASELLAKARRKTIAEDLFPKLTTGSGTSAVFKEAPPTIFHAGMRPGDVTPDLMRMFSH